LFVPLFYKVPYVKKNNYTQLTKTVAGKGSIHVVLFFQCLFFSDRTISVVLLARRLACCCSLIARRH
jgi:hypothetical protein